MIRVFPYRNNWTPTDELAFIGEPPLFRPANMPVRVSVTFTWHMEEAERIANTWRQYYSDVQVGGPAYGDPGGEFTPGLFLKDGCTITSRGCPKSCGWCHVPKREGAIRELAIKPGHIIQDNNLLACSEKHIRAVFDMLREQPEPASFNGGLDKHFLKEWHAELFLSIRLHEVWFACDTAADLPNLDRAVKILADIPQNKRRCYTMVGYDGETLLDAEKRLEAVFNLGFLPFTQLYQPEKPKVYSKEWCDLARNWSRPAIYKSIMGDGAKTLPIQSDPYANTRQSRFFSGA